MDKCDDPDCVGCMTERFIDGCKAQGMDPEDIILMFFDYLQIAFKEDAVLAIRMTEIEEPKGTVH